MIHLIITKGEGLGREIDLPPAGMRVGRSHANDLVFEDEALSQFHCRFFFKSDGSLWVTDFASTNHTLVNNVPITEKALKTGDIVELGTVTLRVIRDTLTDSGTPSPSSVPPPPAPERPTPSYDGPAVIDLGFGGTMKPAPSSTGRSPRLLRIAFALAVLSLVAVGAFMVLHFSEDAPPAATPAAPAQVPLTVWYEKVEGGPDNIFRYALRIENNELFIQIDDIKNRRHVSREKTLDEDILHQLTTALQATSFNTLQSEYVGVSPDVYHLWDLTLILGSRAQRVKVLNRLEPDEFKAVREMLEEYGQAELGLAALALTSERLVELARQSYLDGRKRYEEREVRYGNLAESVRQYTLALWYLETIEPKPDYYVESVQGLEQSRRELESRYQDLIFRTERAIKLKDWEQAAQQLRIVMELIPDRADARNRKAETQLLTVERYLRR